MTSITVFYLFIILFSFYRIAFDFNTDVWMLRDCFGGHCVTLDDAVSSVTREVFSEMLRCGIEWSLKLTLNQINDLIVLNK